jgi:hypothetical protein
MPKEAPPEELGDVLILAFHEDLSVKLTWNPTTDTRQRYKAGVMRSPQGYVCGKSNSVLGSRALETLALRKAVVVSQKHKQPPARARKA